MARSYCEGIHSLQDEVAWECSAKVGDTVSYVSQANVRPDFGGEPTLLVESCMYHR